MQKIIKYIFNSIKYIIGLFLISIVLVLVWQFIPPIKSLDRVQCSNNYPIVKIYEHFNQAHTWKTYDKPFLEIESYLDNTRDGILIDTNTDKITKEISASITYVKNNKWNGYSIGYMNGKLNSIYYYKKGLKTGIHFTLNDGYPSLLVVYSNDVSVGLIGFWDYGRYFGL